MRQRLARVLGGAAVLALVATGAAACKSDEETPGGSAACNLKLGYFGPLTGDAAGLGIHMNRGVKLAIDQYNAAHPDCKVVHTEYDSQGDPAKAPAQASAAIAAGNVGIVGPAFSGETEATLDAWKGAGVPLITPSATRPSLSDKDWGVFHRGVGNDFAQGPAAGRYIKNVMKAEKVFVVDDQSAYGTGLVAEVNKVLGSAIVGKDKVQVKQTNFAPTVSAVKASGATVLFFGGYYTEAGLLLKQLRDAQWTGKMVAGDGVNDANFITVAGAANAEGTVLTCPCAPATSAKGTFVTDYKAAFTDDPGTYADVSYDVTNIFLEGIAAGKSTRADLLAFIDSYTGTGKATGVKYKFEKNGELDPTQVVVWAFQVKGGAVVPDVEIPKS